MPQVKWKKAKGILRAISFAYLFCLSSFLAFGAMWISDGYYPLPWTLKGALFRLAIWLLPASLFLGTMLLAFRLRRKVANMLIAFSISIFTLMIGWTSILHGGRHDLLLLPWVSVPVLAVLATRTLSRIEPSFWLDQSSEMKPRA